MFHMPMSSPMMTTMFGFGCAAAGEAMSTAVANSATRTSNLLLIAFPPRGYRKTLVPVGFTSPCILRGGVTCVTWGGSSADPEAVCHRTLVPDLPRPKDRTLGRSQDQVAERPVLELARIFLRTRTTG